MALDNSLFTSLAIQINSQAKCRLKEHFKTTTDDQPKRRNRLYRASTSAELWQVDRNF